MNEKEAREIVSKGKPSPFTRPIPYQEYLEAKIYLEAIEKAKVLEARLRVSMVDCPCNFKSEEPCDNCNKNGEAIAQWGREK